MLAHGHPLTQSSSERRKVMRKASKLPARGIEYQALVSTHAAKYQAVPGALAQFPATQGD